MPFPSNIPLKTIDGKTETLGDFAGQVLLIVNVAGRLHFTPQYAGLESLHRRYHDGGLSVLGFPCDQFRYTRSQVTRRKSRAFARARFDVTFPPLFAKINVNGQAADPLYPLLEIGKARAAGHQSDQMELHQVPARPGASRGAPLRPDRQAGVARPRHRGGALGAAGGKPL